MPPAMCVRTAVTSLASPRLSKRGWLTVGQGGRTRGASLWPGLVYVLYKHLGHLSLTPCSLGGNPHLEEGKGWGVHATLANHRYYQPVALLFYTRGLLGESLGSWRWPACRKSVEKCGPRKEDVAPWTDTLSTSEQPTSCSKVYRVITSYT